MNPPKSASDLKLHNTFRKDRHEHLESIVLPVGGPTKPDWITGDAEWLWDLVVSQYGVKGPVTTLDTAALMAACDMWSKYRAASEAADNDPVDKDLRIAVINYFAAWERSAAKLGLNPVDRRRVRNESKGDGKPTVRTRKQA